MATFNALYAWYLTIGVIASIVVISMLVIFALRYRARPGKPAPHHKPESWKIALVTVAISLTLLTAVEYQTFQSFSNIEIPTKGDPVYIGVQGFQWGWNFTYPNGKYDIGNLTVPVDEVIVLNITSKDVFHSFGIDSLAVKEDAVPGKTNQLWFNDTNMGVTVDGIRCFELCGVGHAFMIANLTVVSQASWSEWMNDT